MMRSLNSHTRAWLRSLVFVLVVAFAFQTIGSCFIAAQSLGNCGENPATAQTSGDLHEQEDGHVHAHEGVQADHGHDGTAGANRSARIFEEMPASMPSSHNHMTECCGWMCVAAVCSISAAPPQHIYPKETVALPASYTPAGFPPAGIDRPPKFDLDKI